MGWLELIGTPSVGMLRWSNCTWLFYYYVNANFVLSRWIYGIFSKPRNGGVCIKRRPDVRTITSIWLWIKILKIQILAKGGDRKLACHTSSFSLQQPKTSQKNFCCSSPRKRPRPAVYYRVRILTTLLRIIGIVWVVYRHFYLLKGKCFRIYRQILHLK